MFFLFLLMYLVQMYYYLNIFRPFLVQLSLQPSRLAKTATPSNGVSVVICAKNEAHHLQVNLPFIVQQDYTNFEVIVVDDHSTDETAAILSDLERKYSRLRVVSTKNIAVKGQGKKNALTYGIMFAQNDIVLLTDADCYPSSSSWIAEMMAPFNDPQTEIVLGVSPYLPIPNRPLLNGLVQYETTYTALQYLGFAHKKRAYMGVGRNLAYRKTLFEQQSGFVQHQHIASGDDDLFVGSAATPTNTQYVAHVNALCLSSPPMNWQAWIRQKKRHHSTARHYRPMHQINLALLSASHLGLYLSVIIAFFTLPTAYLAAIVALLFIRWYFQLHYFSRMAALNMSLSRWQYPLADLIFVVYYLFFLPILIANTPTKWK